MGYFSPLLGRVFLGHAVSPSPASPLYCVFCLPPREPVGPAGLCEQGLGRSCWCGPSQAARMLISRSAALGLGRMWLAGHSSGPESWPADPGALGLSPIPPVAPLGLWVGQLASAPGFRCGCPAPVSGVGPQSANLGVHNRASGEHWGCLSRVHSPGAEAGGVPEAAAAAESSLTSC